MLLMTDHSLVVLASNAAKHCKWNGDDTPDEDEDDNGAKGQGSC